MRWLVPHASQAMEVTPVVIASVGASDWGANRPYLTWLDMERVLRQRNILPYTSVAASLGVSQFVFVQWVAPFLSEFPEKLSAFYWARRVSHAPMALMNMVSSNVNQWTVLAAMIPLVYGVTASSYRLTILV